MSRSASQLFSNMYTVTQWLYVYRVFFPVSSDNKPLSVFFLRTVYFRSHSMWPQVFLTVRNLRYRVMNSTVLVMDLTANVYTRITWINQPIINLFPRSFLHIRSFTIEAFDSVGCVPRLDIFLMNKGSDFLKKLNCGAALVGEYSKVI